MWKKILTFFILFIVIFSITFLIYTSTLKENTFPILNQKNYLLSPNINSNQNNLRKRDLWISQQLKSMSLREKIAQMFIFRAEGTSLSSDFDSYLRQYKPGGLIFMGDNVTGDLKKYTFDVQKTNPDIPLFTSIDQEGGIVKRIQSDPNPGAEFLRKTPSLICPTQSNTAEILKNNGINLNFGIIADIGYDKKSFIYERTWGEDPQTVSRNVNLSLKCSTQILNTIKHFPGHGETLENSHLEVPKINISYEDWKNRDAIPFQSAINSGANVVMVGQLEYTQIDPNPATLSKKDISLLREMGLDGIVVTDDMNMLTAAGFDPTDALRRAILAGDDVLLYVKLPIAFDKMIDIVESMVKSGEVSEREIGIRLERVLRVKWMLVMQ